MRGFEWLCYTLWVLLCYTSGIVRGGFEWLCYTLWVARALRQERINRSCGKLEATRGTAGEFKCLENLGSVYWSRLQGWSLWHIDQIRFLRKEKLGRCPLAPTSGGREGPFMGMRPIWSDPTRSSMFPQYIICICHLHVQNIAKQGSEDTWLL